MFLTTLQNTIANVISSDPFFISGSIPVVAQSYDPPTVISEELTEVPFGVIVKLIGNNKLLRDFLNINEYQLNCIVLINEIPDLNTTPYTAGDIAEQAFGAMQNYKLDSTDQLYKLTLGSMRNITPNQPNKTKNDYKLITWAIDVSAKGFITH